MEGVVGLLADGGERIGEESAGLINEADDVGVDGAFVGGAVGADGEGDDEDHREERGVMLPERTRVHVAQVLADFGGFERLYGGARRG